MLSMCTTLLDFVLKNFKPGNLDLSTSVLVACIYKI